MSSNLKFERQLNCFFDMLQYKYINIYCILKEKIMEINLQEINNGLKLSDGIKSYECTFDKILDIQIPMVTESKANLLQQTSLNEMVTTLENSSELINIIFCVLNGGGIQSDLDSLRMALLKLCSKSKETMTLFKEQSEDIALQVLKNYRFMRKGMIAQTNKIFDSTAVYASNMGQQSRTFSLEFDNLVDLATKVIKNIEVEYAYEVYNTETMENDLRSMQANIAEQDSLIKSLFDSMSSFNLEYQEKKDILNSSENKTLGLTIANTMTGAVSLGLSHFINVEISNELLICYDQIDGLNKQKNQNEAEQTDNIQEQERVKLNIEKLDKEILVLQNQVNKLTSLLQKNLQIEKDKEDFLTKVEEYVNFVKTNGSNRVTTHMAVQMLVVSIMCLKKVANSLIVDSLYWESLKQYCENLSETTLRDSLISMERYLSKEEIIEIFKSEDFTMAILTYVAKWTAMYYVSDEYCNELQKINININESFQSMPSQEKMVIIAKKSAIDISSNIASQKRDIQLAIDNIKKQLKKD